jgi:hypothetical protein
MATPAAPLPGETPEQRRARLSAAYAVQARIDAQRQAELEAQEEARRKEMQARIDNMLRSAYVLPQLAQLPVPMPTYYDTFPSPVPPVDPGFVMDIPTFRPPLPTPEPYTPPVFEPYTPPMAEPYTPPSMQFSVDMPRMDYARDLYGVIPDNVSMLKRGGLAVKPKKGKC